MNFKGRILKSILTLSCSTPFGVNGWYLLPLSQTSCLFATTVGREVPFVNFSFLFLKKAEICTILSLHKGQLGHQAGTYPSFCSMKQLGVFLLAPAWDVSPYPGYPPPPHIKFAGTHLYTWVERGTVRVKCLAQEHNTMSRARTQTARSRPPKKDKVCDVLHAQRWMLRIVITVDGVVFVWVQRRDAYYRNDSSKYGLRHHKLLFL